MRLPLRRITDDPERDEFIEREYLAALEKSDALRDDEIEREIEREENKQPKETQCPQ